MSDSTVVWSSDQTVTNVRFVPVCDGNCVLDDGTCLKCGHVRFFLNVGGYDVCSACDAPSHKCQCYYLDTIRTDQSDACDKCDLVLLVGNEVVVSPYERTYYDLYQTHVNCWFA